MFREGGGTTLHPKHKNNLGLDRVKTCKNAIKKETPSGDNSNRPFPSCFEPHCQSEAKCKVLL